MVVRMASLNELRGMRCDGGDFWMEWFITRDGKECGPLSLDEVAGLIWASEFAPDGLVWCNGMENWAAANSVPTLWKKVRRPIFLVPRLVWIFVFSFAGVHLVRWMLPDGANAALTAMLAFIPVRYTGVAPELPGGWIAA